MSAPREVASGGKFSIARVARAWYVACASGELGEKPLARTILNTPLVLFRGLDNKPAALLDRCAHRNAPLSLGNTLQGELQCAYHGWRYDSSGVCVGVPGLVGDAEKNVRAVPRFPARDQDGYVWVYTAADEEPTAGPFRLPAASGGYTEVRRSVEVSSTLHAALENALDVPHTAFLHQGLFRGTGRTSRIRVRVTRTTDRVEAEYVGEPRPEGLVGKILSPSGGIVTHFDRFILPSIAQVEYRLGAENHFLITTLCTPVDDFRTRLYAAILFRTRFPGWLVRLLIEPIARRIFSQDAAMLRRQAETARRFGGEHYSSTEVDVLGLQIWLLLKRAEQGEAPAEDWLREFEMEV
ncbi:MAG TPA: aromatic ring-hydroxylating dioxygenase subunit alpha [Candidatus Binatia bacterium]|jgi:phenylpropionate dioxygenase-like ring-hydroxylating dioxygenase large terminal subunit|nr:aromatic ring-hydroxylating dioxygenase subunit alpha [Candidatus Binatia bacterium]